MHNPNTGSHWTSSVLFSLVQELAPLWDPVEDTFDGTFLHSMVVILCLVSFPFSFCFDNLTLRNKSIPPMRSSLFITPLWER